MTMQEEKHNVEDEEQEIDLLELAGKIWDARKTILKWGVVGAVVGIVIAFSIPKEYTTTIKLAPEATDGAKAGGMSGLAAMAGINLGGTQGADAVYPQLYPDVVSSVPFAVSLFDVPVTVSKDDDKKVTVREFLEEDTSSPWWGVVMSLPGNAIGAVMSIFRNNEEEEGTGEGVNTFQLTADEQAIVEAINARVAADVDTKTSVITLSTTMQDPMVSAMLADTVALRLQEYVTNYRTEKARQDLAYAQKLNDEAKAEYYKVQKQLADYIDRNQGIVLRSGQTERTRLENEVSLAYSLYNQTATQLQAAKAKVQQTTPVYTVVQPATVPLRASKPSKMLILVGCVFLAVVAACAWVLFLKDFKLPKKEDAEVK